MSKRPIQLTVFIHEDVGSYSEDKLYINHFDWIADKIAEISGRTMDVNFVHPSDARLISNIDYKTDDFGSLLKEISDLIVAHVNISKTTVTNNSLHKYLVLTRDGLNNTTLGVAYTPGHVGIASITPEIAAAHEVGHMFNAVHEDSEDMVDTYYGIAKTIMYPKNEPPIAFRFSAKNRENIRKYLEWFD